MRFETVILILLLGVLAYVWVNDADALAVLWRRFVKVLAYGAFVS